MVHRINTRHFYFCLDSAFMHILVELSLNSGMQHRYAAGLNAWSRVWHLKLYSEVSLVGSSISISRQSRYKTKY